VDALRWRLLSRQSAKEDLEAVARLIRWRVPPRRRFVQEDFDCWVFGRARERLRHLWLIQRWPTTRDPGRCSEFTADAVAAAADSQPGALRRTASRNNALLRGQGFPRRAMLITSRRSTGGSASVSWRRLPICPPVEAYTEIVKGTAPREGAHACPNIAFVLEQLPYAVAVLTSTITLSAGIVCRRGASASRRRKCFGRSPTAIYAPTRLDAR